MYGKTKDTEEQKHESIERLMKRGKEPLINYYKWHSQLLNFIKYANFAALK